MTRFFIAVYLTFAALNGFVAVHGLATGNTAEALAGLVAATFAAYGALRAFTTAA